MWLHTLIFWLLKDAPAQIKVEMGPCAKVNSTDFIHSKLGEIK